MADVASASAPCPVLERSPGRCLVGRALRTAWPAPCPSRMASACSICCALWFTAFPIRRVVPASRGRQLAHFVRTWQLVRAPRLRRLRRGPSAFQRCARSRRPVPGAVGRVCVSPWWRLPSALRVLRFPGPSRAGGSAALPRPPACAASPARAFRPRRRRLLFGRSAAASPGPAWRPVFARSPYAFGPIVRAVCPLRAVPTPECAHGPRGPWAWCTLSIATTTRRPAASGCSPPQPHVLVRTSVLPSGFALRPLLVAAVSRAAPRPCPRRGPRRAPPARSLPPSC